MIQIIMFTGVVIVLSVLFNGGIIIYTVLKWKKLLFHEVLMVSLFCANFFQALFGYTLPLYALLTETSPFLSSSSHCIFNGYSMLSFALISIFMITIMIVHRHFLIAKPFQARLIKHRRLIAALISCIAWLFGFMCALPPVISREVAFQHLQQRHYCALNWTNESAENSLYIVFLIVLAYLVPVSMYCYVYINGARNLHKSVTSNRVRRSTKRYHIITVLMLVFFLASWTPYSYAGLMALAKSPLSIQHEMVCSTLAKMSSIWNSILYFALHLTSLRCFNIRKLASSCSLQSSRLQGTQNNFEEMYLLEGKKAQEHTSKIGGIEYYALIFAQEIMQSAITIGKIEDITVHHI